MVKGQKKEISDLSYEQAMDELEQIVNQLEENTSNLDEALLLYDRGQGLSKHCTKLLEQAELKIKQLQNSEEKSGDA